MVKPSSLLNLPVFGALSVVIGALLERAGLPVVMAIGVAALALPLWFTPWPKGVRVALAIALMVCPLAWWRAHQARIDLQNDPLGGFVGKELELQGDFDGRFLNAANARVLLRARQKLEAGSYRVVGMLERPTWYRNPGAFDVGSWLASRGAHFVLRVKTAQRLPMNWLERARAHVRLGVRAGLAQREAALMTGIALGDPDELNGLLDAEEGVSWREVFSKSGLSHTMALSGQQISILIFALSFALRWFGWWRFPALLAILGAYWVIVGASPSVTRAVIMGVAVLLADGLGRGKLEVWAALGWSAILSLLVQPLWLFDLGFVLSYLAVLGMVLFVPPMLRVLRAPKLEPDEINSRLARVPLLKHLTTARVQVFAIGGVVATLAAQMLTLPIVAGNFGVISLVSPLSNLLAELLMLPLVTLSFVAGVLGPLAVVINLVVQPLAWLLLEMARLSAALPVLEWGQISLVGLMAYYAVVVGVWLALIGAIRPYQALMVLLAGVLVTLIPWRARDAQVVYFDVGQGDATLIRLPVGDILIDGGGTPQSDFDVGTRVMIPALRSLGVRALTVVATHADTDHVEGLNAVLEHFKISSLIIGHDKPSGEDVVWDALMQTARAKSIPIRAVQRGMMWDLGDAKLNFLNPPPKPFPEDNWNSVAFALEYTSRNGVLKRLLFNGDVPTEVEDTMNPGVLDVLKLGHHGSRFSTGDVLLRRTQPRVAIVSSGASNRYGHPSQAVFERLKVFKPLVFRTDRDGAITYNLETGGISTVTSSSLAGQFGEPGQR